MDDLPVGFRFYPREEELISFYLLNKLNGTRPDIDSVIPVVNIYDYNPWDLPQFAGKRCPIDTEQWFFFTPRQESGGRINRLTENGYWKATGSPGEVYSSQNLRIGMKKTMVFYVGRAPNGRKTNWKMNEYKLFNTSSDRDSLSAAPDANQQVNGELSLCRIYKKSKGARAFDRRPPAEAAIGGEAAVHHHTTEAITISNQQIINPIDSSSSGDVGIIIDSSQSLEIGENYNWDLATDIEPLWDWEEYNWLFI